MGSCVSSRNKTVEPQKIPKKPLVKFSTQKSRFSNRTQNLEKKRKLALGKSLSFKKIDFDSLLKPSVFPLEDPLIKFKKSLFSGKGANLPENMILQDFILWHKEFQEFKIIKNQGNSILIQCFDEKKRLLLIKRKTFETVESFSEYLLYIQKISKFSIKGIETFEALKLRKSEEFGYLIDIIKEKKGANLNTYIDSKTERNYLEILEIIKKISIILHELHRNNVAFKTLKPSTILIMDDLSVILSIGGTHSSEKEDDFIDFYVKNEEDYKSFDIIALGFILVILLTNNLKIEDLLMARNNQDIAKILEKSLEIPRIFIDFMKKVLDLENKRLFMISYQLISELESLILKGVQNEFKSDFLIEIFKNKPLKNTQDFLYFHYKNKIFVYQASRKITVILRVFLGNRKWKIRTKFLRYCENLKAFFTLVDIKGGKIAKISFDIAEILSNNNQKLFDIKREIEFFHEISQKSSFSHEILTTKASILLISDEIIEMKTLDPQIPEITETILAKVQISNGYRYSFLDSAQESLYILHESPDFFKNGISMSILSLQKPGIPLEIKLDFTLNNPKMLKDFQSISCQINPVYFCLEITDKVFFANISKVLLVLDLENRKFYSFSSFFLLFNYEFAKKVKPNNFAHKFEVRSLPFPLDFSLGSFFFEDGILEFFCKKNSELLLCKFIVFPNQSCISLINCQDLSLGKDFMIVKPKEVKLDWSLVQKATNDFEKKPENIKKIREYEIISEYSQQNDVFIEYKAKKGNENFCIRKFKVEGLEEFEKIFKNFLFILDNSYVLETYDLFLIEENGVLFAIIIREHFERCLLEEFLHRKTKGKYYSAKNLAFLLKCLFKGLVYLNRKKITHGNLDLSNIVITDKGFIKIKGWYYENKQNFASDLKDLAMVLLDLARLELNYEFNEKTLMNAKEFLEINYPGLHDFLGFLLENEKKNIDFKELEVILKKTYFQLMYKDFEFSKYLTEKQRLFWINYGSNSIISAEISSQNHQLVKVLDSQQKPYVFSTFNSFAFDLNEKLYITGNKRYFFLINVLIFLIKGLFFLINLLIFQINLLIF